MDKIMKKVSSMTKEEVKKHIRMGVVGLLGCLCLICMSGEPINDETWWSDFFISKLIAAAFGVACYALHQYWDKRGMLPEISDDDDEW